MTKTQIIQAWRDEEFYEALPAEAKREIPSSPAGEVRLRVVSTPYEDKLRVFNTANTDITGCCSTLISNTCSTLITDCCSGTLITQTCSTLITDCCSTRT